MEEKLIIVKKVSMKSEEIRIERIIILKGIVIGGGPLVGWMMRLYT